MRRMRKYPLLACLALVMELAAVVAAAEPLSTGTVAEDRPFLAVWRKYGGRQRLDPPFLRFAMWSDGRVLYAQDPSQWNHDLRRAKVTASRVARVKAALVDSGVFALQGTCYLVPSAPCDCLMIDLGDKQQMLYWDERETPGYGINTDPKPHHLEFKRCWKAVNHLGLVALPDQGETVEQRIKIPESWYLRRAVQSE